jgi:hypothetical protein
VSSKVFGVGFSGGHSSGFSSAHSSGSTQIHTNSKGSGTEDQSLNAQFNSNVICYGEICLAIYRYPIFSCSMADFSSVPSLFGIFFFIKGPNACTPDDMYQQLMSNNATWNVIDRGETSSYMAVWDLIDYVGQGGLFEQQIKLLQTSWEEMALTSEFNDTQLLRSLITDYDCKKSMFDFVQNLIMCIPPFNDQVHVDQFKAVVTNAVQAQQTVLQSNPTAFINAGFQKFDSNIKPFQLAENSLEYRKAAGMMCGYSKEDWANSFKYYNVFSSTFMDRGKSSCVSSLAAGSLAVLSFFGSAEAQILSPLSLFTNRKTKLSSQFVPKLQRRLGFHQVVVFRF